MAINFMRSSAISSLRREPRGRAAISMIKLLVKDEIRRFPRPNRDHSRTLADGWDRRRVRFRIEGFVSAYRFSDTANLLNQTPLQGLGANILGGPRRTIPARIQPRRGDRT